MSTTTRTRPATARGLDDSFRALVRAEWTKFRTVRGWVIGMLIAALVTVVIVLLDHSSCGIVTPNGAPVGCSATIGPAGEAVTDDFYFAAQPLTGNGSLTARLTALTGQPSLGSWAKGGIIMKASTRPGSAYAAIMLTGTQGVRMQYDYTGDIAAPGKTAQAGSVSAATPLWLRLVRSGDSVTGYESADGTAWTTVGTVTLAGLPGTIQAGLFATSPGTSRITSESITGTSSSGGIAYATAVLDHVSLASSQPAGPWRGVAVGRPGPGTGFRHSGGRFAVTGSGDIAPGSPNDGGTPVERTLFGAVAGLITLIVVAVMFMTAEYRRGLLRVSLAASPRRGRLLAAKALVIGSVSFAAALAGGLASVPLGEWLLRSNGNFILPASGLTQARVIVGTAAILAIAALFALALGAIMRSTAGAITTAIVTTVLPYLLATTMVLPAGAGDWLLALTPAAGFAIQQSQTAYPQVIASYTPGNGYYPLAPWAGFAVLCGYAIAAFALALVLLRRRDA
ncbi:MAG TPA: ABC transporter permease subunit [Streptosporangiaceae bacterium]|jgi:ABC-type transport system involved in multi-copper enzyme maturation permease subunit|nr:ABC transporter permease subunit [Streptosporangiaceae bacterium]